MAEEIHVGDWGTFFLARVRDGSIAINLEDYTAYKFRFKSRSTNTVEVQPAIWEPAALGRLYYFIPQTFAGGLFFHEKGPWKWQIVLTSPIGVWRSNVVTFQVYDNI